MINPLFDISQYQSGATQSYSTDWIDATGSDAAWDESELHPGWKNSTTEPDGNAQDSSTEAPTMAEQKAPESSYAEVEVVEELSQKKRLTDSSWSFEWKGRFIKRDLGCANC
jgi:hypothetical protein